MDWLKQRLFLLARERQAKVDSGTIEHFASSLSGFASEAVDVACAELGRTPREEGQTAFPDLGDLLNACRRAQGSLVADTPTHWTLERYREAWYLDRYIDEQMAFNGLTREEAVGKLDDASRAMWLTWKNQTLAGTIQVPPLWHEPCRGTGLIPVWGRSPNPEVTTPVCMRQRPCECGKAER